jgi:molybdopterin/thiamine biosynthesis adenylyltransferase
LLDFEDLNLPKAVAVADRVRAFHPDVQVTAEVADAVEAWPQIESADLIIDATGDPNVASALNEKLLRSDRTALPALLHSWVFGNGVAAQSFLNLRDGLACYRCLAVGFGGPWRHNPLKDASSPLRQAAARCGEAGYVPFAVDAPVAAAGLAVGAALDWARAAPGHRLRTIIVDHAAGRDKMPWASPAPLNDCVACAG